MASVLWFLASLLSESLLAGLDRFDVLDLPLGGEVRGGGTGAARRSIGGRPIKETGVQDPPLFGLLRRIKSTLPSFILVFHFSSLFLRS